MPAGHSRVALLLALVLVLAGCSSSSAPGAASDPIVPCTLAAFPNEGDRCDPTELGPQGYCRQSEMTCGWNSAPECTCGADARWHRDDHVFRDGLGCGTPPHCTQLCGADGGVCPILEPTEGAVCASVGTACPGYGSLSCPETATCGADGKWRVTCPETAFGADAACTCAHPASDADGGVDADSTAG
jgi:hypothetical protein